MPRRLHCCSIAVVFLAAILGHVSEVWGCTIVVGLEQIPTSITVGEVVYEHREAIPFSLDCTQSVSGGGSGFVRLYVNGVTLIDTVVSPQNPIVTATWSAGPHVAQLSVASHTLFGSTSRIVRTGRVPGGTLSNVECIDQNGTYFVKGIGVAMEKDAPDDPANTPGRPIGIMNLINSQGQKTRDIDFPQEVYEPYQEGKSPNKRPRKLNCSISTSDFRIRARAATGDRSR